MYSYTARTYSLYFAQNEAYMHEVMRNKEEKKICTVPYIVRGLYILIPVCGALLSIASCVHMCIVVEASTEIAIL